MIGNYPPLYELGEIEALKQENKELKEQLNSIGAVYGGSFVGTELASGKYTNIAQVEVPPGTYLLIGASQLTVSIGGIFVLNLENVAIRFSGSGGGGACTSVVKSTDTTKIFRMRMYKPAGENTSVKTDGVNLWAIKIK